MTKTDQSERLSTSQPWLSFDPADLVSLRVRPAEFARMCQVSRQAVSKWVKNGVITLDPDGLMDPVKAGRQLLARTDPGKLRARVFRDAFKDVDELRADNKRMKAENAELRASLATHHDQARYWMHMDEANERLEAFISALTVALETAGASDRLSETELDYLAGRHFWRLTDEQQAGIDDGCDGFVDEAAPLFHDSPPLDIDVDKSA